MCWSLIALIDAILYLNSSQLSSSTQKYLGRKSPTVLKAAITDTGWPWGWRIIGLWSGFKNGMGFTSMILVRLL
jgi:hypothetical protein